MVRDVLALRRVTRIAFAGLALAAVLGVAGLVFLAQLGIPATLIDGGYWTLGVLVAAFIAVGAHRYRGTVGSAVVGGLAGATTVVSGAFVLALTGAIFSWGHDGLAFAIGLGAGCLLLQLVIAPRMAQAGATSLAGLFAMQFPGRLAGMTCAGVVVLAMLTLLVAELMAAGLIGARVLGLSYASATAVAAVVVLACFALRGFRGAAWTNGALLPLLLIALAVPLVILSAIWYGVPLPQIAYANALWQVQGLEEMLLEQDLADPAFMRPMLTPFVALTPVNFLGIVLGLAAGAAVVPTVLGGLSPPLERSARSARSAALWTLGFVVLLLTLFPVAAAYAKLSLATLVADRTPIAELPGWVFTYGRLGLLQICERAATDVESVIAACAALPDGTGALALHDIAIDPDALLLAMPEMTGLSGGAFGLLAVAVLAVVLTTASGPLGAAVRALTGDGRGAMQEAAASRRQYTLGLALGALLVGVAAAVASRHPAEVIEVAAWAFTLTAAGFFPALFAALWWRRVTAAGAIAGMFAGLAVVLVYLVGTQQFPVQFYEAQEAISGSGASGDEYFVELKEAWLEAAPGEMKDIARAALDAHARSAASLWGIGNLAAALLALPAGIFALVAVSLLTRARSVSAEAEPISPQRANLGA